MESCECNGDKDAYFDYIEYDCVPKIGNLNMYKYDVNEKQCINVCQLESTLEAQRYPNFDFNVCGENRKSLDNNLGKLLNTVQYYTQNINKYNNLTLKLIQHDKNMYIQELNKIDKDMIKNIGGAKILAQGSLNSKLADAVNIYTLPLYVIGYLKLNINILAIDNIPELDIDNVKDHEILDAVFDLGCSVGSL